MIKNLILGLALALSVPVATGCSLVEKTAQANDGCGGSSQSKRAVKSAGGSGYPSVCRTNVCHSPNAYASQSHINYGNMTVVIDWFYSINGSAAAPGTPLCPSDVQAGGSNGWQSP